VIRFVGIIREEIFLKFLGAHYMEIYCKPGLNFIPVLDPAEII
jgi:hypothetical protein